MVDSVILRWITNPSKLIYTDRIIDIINIIYLK